MDYKKHYNLLIEKAKKRKSIKGYYEIHHIIPKCLNGKDTKDNLVKLNAREHFVAHWLLHRAHPDEKKLSFAFKMLATVKTPFQNRYTPSSRIIAEAKEAAAKATSELTKGIPKSYEHSRKVGRANLGKKRSAEVRAKLSALKKGKPTNRGIPVSQFDYQGNFIRSYRTIAEAEKTTGINGTNIRSATTGKYKQSGGFVWKVGIYGGHLNLKREIIKDRVNFCTTAQLEKIEEILEIANNLKD